MLLPASQVQESKNTNNFLYKWADIILFYRYYSVRVGSKDPLKGGQLVGVKNIVKHDEYNATSGENDIALVFLSSAVNFTEVVLPAGIQNPDLRTGGFQNKRVFSPEDCRRFFNVPVRNNQVCGAVGHSPKCIVSYESKVKLQLKT